VKPGQSQQENCLLQTATEERRALDLFSGTGSVGDRLRELGYEVVSLDISPACRPTIVADILNWQFRKKYPPGYFEVIAASVPCTEYSQAKTVGERKYKLADKIVRRTVEIIEYFQPRVWWIENPRTGRLKRRSVLWNQRWVDVDYCQFST
jgi:site-specific DNA-cytosine methylase